jgi:hypothetical protein
MRRNLLAIATVAAAFTLATTWLTPAFPATLPVEATRSPGADLSDLAALHATLRQRGSDQVQSLESSCEFGLIRDRLVEVRDEAVHAVRRIGGLWREGRLRDGGFALSEVLVYDFAALVNDLIWSIAAADALAILQTQTLQAPDAQDVAARIAAIHPSAAACVARRPEQTPIDSASVRRSSP